MTSDSSSTPETAPRALLERLCSRPAWVLALGLLALLGGFLAKPFHIDDPLFLQVARQIQEKPLDPYGCSVNWYGTASPMWEVLKNPPLASYYLALSASVLGGTEPALHVAFLLPALAVILGTYRLAREWCRRPWLAAGITLVTPVFLVSSTTLMCDVLMLALWVWATVLWLEGTKRANHLCLGGAAVLMALAGLTKYFGVALMPLLAMWSLVARQRIRTWLGWFIVPLVVLTAYQGWTRLLYGQELLSGAGEYALLMRTPAGLTQRLATSLSFVGGGLAVAVFLAPLLWSRRSLAIGSAGALLLAFLLALGDFMVQHTAVPDRAARIVIVLQIAVWSCAGICVLALAVADIITRGDAGSWFLGLWIGATFLFAAFLNWTISGRAILPMAVPFGILAARRYEWKCPVSANVTGLSTLGPLLAGAALGWFVARSDYVLARATRQAAQAVTSAYGQGRSALWFGGHWGFQHYLEAAGALALDLDKPSLQPGDHLALPRNNSNVRLPGNAVMTIANKIELPGPTGLTTMNKALGAGFYSSVWGPLPFAFGRVPPEGVDVYVTGPSPPGPVGAAAEK